MPWTSVVRGTFFATGGAGGAADPFVCVCAIVMMPAGMTAASSSAGSVSLFILSPFSFRVSEDFDGEFAADYRKPHTGHATGRGSTVCGTNHLTGMDRMHRMRDLNFEIALSCLSCP